MDETTQRELQINKLLRIVRKYDASDLYLDVGSAPRVRLRGVIRTMDARPMTQDDLVRLVVALLYAEQVERLNSGEKIDFTYSFDEGEVYRVVVSNDGGRYRLIAHRVGAG